MNKKAKVTKVNAIIDSLLKELSISDSDNKSIKIEDIDFNRFENYDTSKVRIWEFRNKGDMRNGIELNLGNMINLPLEVNGIRFENSECAYIAGLYSSGDRHSNEVQKILSTHRNGLFAKKEFRYRDNNYCVLKRTDWEEFNIEWMKYVIWCEINTSSEFRNLLMSIPSNVTLVEDVSFMTGDKKLVWGCENQEMKKVKKDMLKLLKLKLIEEGITYNNQYRQMLFNRIHNIGVFSGFNVMDKILS